MMQATQSTVSCQGPKASAKWDGKWHLIIQTECPGLPSTCDNIPFDDSIVRLCPVTKGIWQPCQLMLSKLPDFTTPFLLSFCHSAKPSSDAVMASNDYILIWCFIAPSSSVFPPEPCLLVCCKLWTRHSTGTFPLVSYADNCWRLWRALLSTQITLWEINGNFIDRNA